MDTLTPIIKDKTVVATCIYGSRIAGYAKENSDYDVIVVLENYKNIVRYKYLKGNPEVSALLVDKKALFDDAIKARLGEFVVGRFLNIFKSISGDEIFNEIEAIYKKRIILEIIKEIELSYGELSTIIKIPQEYFLFEKLKKRAALYPPARYSYVQTYMGQKWNENLKASLSGFREPFSQLEKEGIISINENIIKINSPIVKNRQFNRITTKMTNTTRGIAQYAVHGFAGRVGLNVIVKEMLSKINRNKSRYEVPEFIRHPKTIWELDDALLIIDCDSWLKEISQYLKMDDSCKYKKKRLGEFYSTTQKIELTDSNKKYTIAAKKFKDPKNLKWAFLNIWASAKKFENTPDIRMCNEYKYLKMFKEMNFLTPKVIGLFLSDLILVMNYIEGVDLGTISSEFLRGKSQDLEPIRLYGDNLGRLHSKGYTLGDTKPSNAIYNNSKLYFTDLEQASKGGDYSWDIGEFIYYSLKMCLQVDNARILVDTFKKAYLQKGYSEALTNATDRKYVRPFAPIVIPKVVKVVRESFLRDN